MLQVVVATIVLVLVSCSSKDQPAKPVAKPAAPTPAASQTPVPPSSAEAGGELETVARVVGPMAIGFFPPITQKEKDEDDGGLSEGYAHLSFALEDLEKCLAPRKIEVRVKITRSLQLQDGKANHQLQFSMDWEHAVGIVLVAPGRDPQVVYATAGPSSLLELAPQAAWKYFSEPNCKRYEE